MPIAIKRTEKVNEAERDAEAIRQEQERALARKQREDLRAEAIASLRKLGKGLRMWEDAGWEWQPLADAKASDPEEWAGLARVLYRLAQVVVIDRQLTWMAISKDVPYWCQGCHPGEERPEGQYAEECPAHNHAPSLAIGIGFAIFGEGKDER